MSDNIVIVYLSYASRSLEYVGPILKMLNAAYDKYASKAHHSNSITNNSVEKDKASKRRR